jgi:hypothetical protein
MGPSRRRPQAHMPVNGWIELAIRRSKDQPLPFTQVTTGRHTGLDYLDRDSKQTFRTCGRRCQTTTVRVPNDLLPGWQARFSGYHRVSRGL